MNNTLETIVNYLQQTSDYSKYNSKNYNLQCVTVAFKNGGSFENLFFLICNYLQIAITNDDF